MVPASAASADALPIDVSLGIGEASFPTAAHQAVRDDLAKFVVPAVSDALAVIQRELSARLQIEEANRDALTGLWSRRALLRTIDRTRSGDTVALLDLDHFKQVNDTLGHEAGDQVLAAFGRHLSAGVRDRDMIGRLGGEEFVVVFPNTEVAEAVAVLQRLQRTWHASAPQDITFSGGVVAASSDASASQVAGRTCLRRADSLMYVAKRTGRDRIISEADLPDEIDLTDHATSVVPEVPRIG